VTALRDLGERRIVREILPDYVIGIGSDCANIDLPNAQIVTTTDPVPEPAAKILGGDPDLYWMGWLLVVINASDLSAAGASPLAFLAAIEAPADLEVQDFRRLLLGIKECCAAEGLRYVGGNLREAHRVAAVGTALGLSPAGGAITREGAKFGDVLVSIGTGGIFWRDVLSLRAGLTIDKSSSPLFRPRSQLSVMNRLVSAHLVTAAIDNSDGLLPTLQQFASANGRGIVLDLERLRVPGIPRTIEPIDPARLWLGWGDWNVVAAIRDTDVAAAQRLAEDLGGFVLPIGRFSESQPEVVLKRGDVFTLAPRLESERFAADSWFSAGIDAYLNQLTTVSLP
jgi:thiamine-monophosphate kinase